MHTHSGLLCLIILQHLFQPCLFPLLWSSVCLTLTESLQFLLICVDVVSPPPHPVLLMYQTSQCGCSVFSKLHFKDYAFWLWSFGPLSQRSIDFTRVSLFAIFSLLSHRHIWMVSHVYVCLTVSSYFVKWDTSTFVPFTHNFFDSSHFSVVACELHS